MAITSTTASEAQRHPISRLLRSLVVGNPLLGHGPRTHANGVELNSPAVAARPVRRRRAAPPLEVPRVHLGRAGRL